MIEISINNQVRDGDSGSVDGASTGPPPPVSMVNRGCNVEEDAADTEDARTARAGQLM